MEEKAFKKMLNNQTEDIKRHTEMLLGTFRHLTDNIIEMQNEQTKKLDKLIQMLFILEKKLRA